MTSALGPGTKGLSNVDALLRRQASEHPDSSALVDGAGRLTWREVDEQVEALARGLAELGLVAGHRVAIVSANRVEFVVGYLAVLRGGMIAVPVNPASPPSEIRQVLDDSGARICLAANAPSDDSQAELGGPAEARAGAGPDTVAAVRAAVRGAAAAVLVVVIGAEPEEGEIAYADLPSAGPRIVSPRDPEAIAVLFYASGTGGRPRAAMLSHRALLANIEQAASTAPPPVRYGDVVLGVVPMFHVYGLNAVLGQVLLTGATLVLGHRFDPEQTLALVEREQVTCLPVAPPAVAAWLTFPAVSARLASVTRLVSAAAPLAEETVRAFETTTGIPVQQGYGLTEAGPVVTSTIGASTHKPGSAGQPLPGVELRVVEDGGVDLSGAEPGEIWVRGASLFSGYWPERDADPGADGWLHTGDVGYLDVDGDLFLVDRLTELVVVSGFNVYPSEIEEVIAELEVVRECAVIGAPRADTGEMVVAYVVPASPDSDHESLGAAVTAHCTERLARFKVPSRVEVVSELPHSVTGKVARGRLRASRARRDMGLA